MNIQEISGVIETAGSKASGKLAVAFQDMETGISYGYHDEEIVPTASVYKLFTLAELYRQAESGVLDMMERCPLEKEKMSMGSGILRNLQPGAKLTLYDYAMLMMTISDNTAADLLYTLVGKENIYHNILRPLRLKSTKVDYTCKEMLQLYLGYEIEEGETSEHYFARAAVPIRNSSFFRCEEEKNTQTTAEEVRRFLKALYDGILVSGHACKEMLKILKKCQTNSRIPRYLPKEVEVAHKTGTLDRLANDAGIVYSEKGNYILTMFYNGNVASEEEYGKNTKGTFSDELLAGLSRDIYTVYIK